MAMLHDAHLPRDRLGAFAPKHFVTASKLNGMTQVTLGGMTASRREHFGDFLPKFASHLRTWGEAGTVKLASNFSSKLLDRGIICVFVGYADNHNGDCFETWDLATGSVHVSRNVI